MGGWRRVAARLAIPAMLAASAAGFAALSRWGAPPGVAAGPTSPGGEAEQLAPPSRDPLPGEYRGPTAEEAVGAMERRWAEEAAAGRAGG